MVTRQKHTGRAVSIPSGLAAGAITSIMVTLIVSAVGAWMIAAEVMPQKQIGYCSVVSLLLAAIFGSLTAMKRVKRKTMMVGLLNGGVYYGILIILTVLFFGGNLQGMGVTMVVVLLGSLTGILINNGGRRWYFGNQHRKVRR